MSQDAVGLGQATMMDRDLAAQHGVAYVHLAAFAIDVDRIYGATEDETLPLGWEVFLLLAYVLGRFAQESERDRLLLEDTASTLLASGTGEPRLGACLAFALHEGTARELLDPSLKALFKRWRSPSKQLKKALDAQFADPTGALVAAATHCLETPLHPPLSPPTVASLQQMVDGEFELPALTGPPAT